MSVFKRLASIFSKSRAPSALIIVGDFPSVSIFHCVPESGYIEHFSITYGSNRTHFRQGGAVEQARERIGTLRIFAGELVEVEVFRDELKPKVRKLWSGTFGKEPRLDPQEAKAFTQADTVDVARLVEDVLRPAMLEIIHEREGREDLVDVGTLPVYIVHVNRSRLGLIFGTEPTSITS